MCLVVSGTVLASSSTIAQPVISCDDKKAELSAAMVQLGDTQAVPVQFASEQGVLQADLSAEASLTTLDEIKDQILANETDIENQEILIALYGDDFQSTKVDDDDNCKEAE